MPDSPSCQRPYSRSTFPWRNRQQICHSTKTFHLSCGRIIVNDHLWRSRVTWPCSMYRRSSFISSSDVIVWILVWFWKGKYKCSWLWKSLRKKIYKNIVKDNQTIFNYLLVVILFRCQFLPCGIFLRSCSCEVQSPRVTQ